MIAQLSKWGNSVALRLPKTILKEVNLKESDNVELHVESGIIQVRKADSVPKVDLAALFTGYEGGKPEMSDWGRSEGREEW